MSSKTKIVVLHLKELIYTGIFAVLGILFIVLLIIMFLPKGKDKEATATTQTVSYVPGVYTTSLVLNDNTVDIAVTVDESNINDIRLVNLDEAVATMYPLIEPAFEDLASQICTNQSLDGITYSDDNKYTSLVLLDAISAALEKARITNDGQTLPITEGSPNVVPQAQEEPEVQIIQETPDDSAAQNVTGTPTEQQAQPASEAEAVPEAAPEAQPQDTADNAAEASPEYEAQPAGDPQSNDGASTEGQPEAEGQAEAEAQSVPEE